MPDGWEIKYNLNPLNPVDASHDDDYDGLINLEEYLHGTDPQKRDSDADGFDDGVEIALGTDPLNPFDNPRTRLTIFSIMLVISCIIAFLVIIRMVKNIWLHHKYQINSIN